MTNSKHASGIGGSLVQTVFEQSDSVLHEEVSEGEEMTIYIPLICRLPDLCLVVGACNVNFRGLFDWE